MMNACAPKVGLHHSLLVLGIVQAIWMKFFVCNIHRRNSKEKVLSVSEIFVILQILRSLKCILVSENYDLSFFMIFSS